MLDLRGALIFLYNGSNLYLEFGRAGSIADWLRSSPAALPLRLLLRLRSTAASLSRSARSGSPWLAAAAISGDYSSVFLAPHFEPPDNRIMRIDNQ